MKKLAGCLLSLLAFGMTLITLFFGVLYLFIFDNDILFLLIPLIVVTGVIYYYVTKLSKSLKKEDEFDIYANYNPNLIDKEDEEEKRVRAITSGPDIKPRVTLFDSSSYIEEDEEEEAEYNDFLVVGNRNGILKDNLDTMIEVHVARHKNKPCSGNTMSELKEVVQRYPRIYKYSIYTKATLREEPDNDYDKRAIAVYWKETKIGYIRRVDRERVEPLLDNERVNLKIKAGPFAQEGYDDLEFIDEHRVTIQ